MAENNLATKNEGDIISSNDVNQYKDALSPDVVPRDIDGVPTDVSGGLGVTIYRWGVSYIKKIFFGAAAQEWAIDNTGDNLTFSRFGVIKSFITTLGFDANYVNPTTEKRLQLITVLSSQVVNVPADCTDVLILGCGSGGGGGGGLAATGGGGGGGGGIYDFVIRNVVASSALTLTIPAGGAGGAVGLSGTNGGNSTVTGTGLSITFYAGAGGGTGAVAGKNSEYAIGGGTAAASGGGGGGATGPGGRGDTFPGGAGSTGMNGGGGGGAYIAGINGLRGGNTAYALGGAAGTGASAGGGGGASLGAGGAGGNAGLAGTAGAVNTGGGGGGGAIGFAGAAGGSGKIVLCFITRSTVEATLP